MDYENNENIENQIEKEESGDLTPDTETASSSDKGPKIYYENMVSHDEEEESKTVKVKKKRILNTPIIIAICIVAVTILGFLAYDVFFNSTIYGTWTFDDETATATDDEINPAYYTFNSDGTAYVTCGTVTFKGTITMNESDNSKASIYIPSFIGEQEFNIAVTGNKLMTRHLILSNDNVTGSFTSASEKKSTVDKYEDFALDEDIVDTWVDSYYGVSYTFNEDGTMIMNQSDMIVIEGVYTTDKENNKMTVKYVVSEEVESEMSYGYDKANDVLVINGLGLTRASQASADEG